MASKTPSTGIYALNAEHLASHLVGIREVWFEIPGLDQKVRVNPADLKRCAERDSQSKWWVYVSNPSPEARYANVRYVR